MTWVSRPVRRWVRRRVLQPLVGRFTLQFAEMVAVGLKALPDNAAYPIFARHGFHLLRRHYYLPVPEAEDLSADYFQRQSDMPGVAIDDQVCLELMESVGRFMDEFRQRFPMGRTRDPGQFYLINGTYMAVDAHVYYGLIRHYKPRRIVEIGAGNSTLLAAAACVTNQQETGQAPQLIAVEPYPGDILRKGHPGLTELVSEKVQEVDLSLFTSLQAGDILFIDSSHVLRAGNDVQWEYLEILPRLAPGVMVHIHDVSLPKAYPKVYFDSHLYWNEQDLLQAFLAFNNRFEVIWPGNYMMLRHPKRMLRVFPEIERMRQDFPSSEPTAFWMRIRAA